jgi:pimeloyl-ACP methyl ester carboxylesterase
MEVRDPQSPVHTTTVRDARLAWTEPECTRDPGRTTVWAHGLTSSATGQEQSGMFDWSPVARDRRLIRYDARGHGQSTGGADPEEYTWPNLGRDLLGLLDVVCDGKPVGGIGSSMGTATLLWAAVTEPGRFDRLVLTTPPTAGQVRAAHVTTYRSGADLIEREGLAAYEEATAAPPPAVLSDLGDARTALAVSESLLPSVLRGAARSDLPANIELRALRIPVLVLAWSGDPGHPLSTARRLADVIPDAELQIADTPAQLRRWPESASRFLTA